MLVQNLTLVAALAVLLYNYYQIGHISIGGGWLSRLKQALRKKNCK